jgi:hypothetical protein
MEHCAEAAVAEITTKLNMKNILRHIFMILELWYAKIQLKSD